MSADLLRDAALKTPSFPVPAPAEPLLIRPLPGKPLRAATVDQLARHIHGLRGQRGLRFGKVMFASYAGSDTFPCFHLYAIDHETQGEEWIGAAAFQAAVIDKLQDALRRTEPQGVAA